MPITQLQVLAWTANGKRTVKIKNPTKQELLPAKAKILAALNAVVLWLDEAKGKRPKPPNEAVLRPLIEAFGYDPFIGDVYRGIRTDKVLKVGDTVVYRPPFDFTSWTADSKRARRFASSEYLADIKRPRAAKLPYGYIIRLQGNGLQLWSTHYILAILDYLLSIRFDTSIKKLRSEVAAYAREDEVMMKLPEKVKVFVSRVVK